MKTLLIDAGNSQLKWAALNHSDLSRQETRAYCTRSPDEIFEEVINHHLDDCKAIYLVTVLGERFLKNAQSLAKKKKVELFNIQSQNSFAGINNAYSEPHKLGADRFVAMIAAYHLNIDHNDKKQARIVIDSGSATTIDAVDETGQHLGGVILPGLHLCTESLLKNTELLPLWSEQSIKTNIDCFSKDTTQAIASGCILGLTGAIDNISKRMETKINKNEESFSPVIKIITGGSAKTLLPYLQSKYCLYENLLMLGLKTININYPQKDN